VDQPNDPVLAPTPRPADPAAPRLPPDVVAADKLAVIADLAPGLIHELNNALAGIAGFAQLARLDPALPDGLREQANRVADEAERARRLVQGLLEFVRRRAPERHPTPIRPLVQSVLDLEAYRIAGTAIDVLIEVPPDLPPVRVDRPAVQHVLLLLTGLALETAQRGGRLRIAAADDSAVVRITVAGGAQQIDTRLQPRLAVAAQIIASHGGRLWQDSAASSFVVELPIEAAASPEGRHRETVAIGQSPRLERPCVLVVDDEASIRQFLDRALAHAGCKAVLAADAPAALALIRDVPFDAVLSDQRIGLMRGVDLYDAAVAVRPELATRFVLMTGDVLDPKLRAFVDQHRIVLIEKPFDLETVTRTVGAIVGRSAGGAATETAEEQGGAQSRG